jgi:hypothetical protein
LELLSESIVVVDVDKSVVGVVLGGDGVDEVGVEVRGRLLLVDGDEADGLMVGLVDVVLVVEGGVGGELVVKVDGLDGQTIVII